jgi:hypothetical protein
MKRLAYPILTVILIAIVFVPLLLHPGHLLYPQDGQATDLTITHWPAVAYNVRSLRQDGQIPLWRTIIASGGPWAANPQSWLIYPPAWLFFLLPINLTFNLLLMAHLVLAAESKGCQGRQALDLKPPGAALAGLAFALAPWLSGQLAAGHINVVLALAWLPVALLGLHRAATTGRVAGALLAGVAWAAAILNHFQMAAFAVLLALAWYLLIVLRRDAPAGWSRRFGLLLLALAVALLLSAALLVPLGEALPYLNRTALTVEEAGALSLPWASLLATIIPAHGGEPEQLVYLGLPAFLLAVVGLVLKRDRVSWFLVIVAALAAAFSLGTHGPLFPLLFRWMPGLGWLRVPPRAWVLVAFCLALLAGRGLDILLPSNLTPVMRRRVTLTGLVALAVTLTLAGGLLIMFQPTPPAVWSLAAFAVLSATALLLRARARLQARYFALAFLILAAADLGLVRAAWTEMRAPADAFAWGAKVAEYLARQPDGTRSYSPSYSLPQHTAIQHALALADGVDPIQLAHYAGFLSTAGGYEVSGYSPSLPPVLDDTSARPDAGRLGLLNVGYVAADFPILAEGLVLEQQIDGTYLYRNEKVLPRAFVVPYAERPAEIDIRLELPIVPGPAQIVTYTPNRIVVEADLETPGLLVLSEVWYPGWRARVDGLAVSIRRVEGTLRGVILDPGAHTVEFGYSPWTAWVGLAISVSSMLALLVYGVIRAWRRS